MKTTKRTSGKYNPAGLVRAGLLALNVLGIVLLLIGGRPELAASAGAAAALQAWMLRRIK